MWFVPQSYSYIVNRRGFLACSLFGWIPVGDRIPFFHRSRVELAGVNFLVRRGGRSGRRYLLLHGNEDTAREVLNIHMYTYPGIAYIVDNPDRYVTIEGAKIDPNRLFSRAGAEKSLRAQNPNLAPDRMEAVLTFLDRHREDLIRHVEPKEGNLLFALHNNRDYSVTEEVAQSDETSLKEPGRPREFFLCTDRRDFEVLRQSPYNVVLQNQKPSEDDGSLSRLAAKRRFRYVNLECGIGEIEAQLERVRWVEDHL